ncbi:hypothetical protein [Blastopirellula marina]|uniref:Outer membrane lipoprotein-sorting protein n=1 Tax=Blastopirellula marina TaxID=124 RepID=A0A2S8GT73_9BACT|nr:hypothetical protein [Blastopirellula marina]PQO47610.1 hypothetical protein C5Y93_02830 [Blastopirellula marina]
MNAIASNGKVLLVAPLLSLLISGATLLSAAEVTKEDIQTAWNARTEQLSKFRIEWLHEQHISQGAFSASPFGLNPKAIHPAADIVLESAKSLTYDHRKMRRESSGDIFSEVADGGHDLVRYDRTASWDGKRLRSLYFSGGGNPYASIKIRGSDRFVSADENLPLKTLSAELPFLLPLRSYRITGTTEEEGKTYLVLTKRTPPGFVPEEVWLQATPPYLPVKFLVRSPARIAYETTVEYATDDQGRNYPNFWTVRCFDEVGNLRIQNISKVTSIDFDPATTDEDFHLDFPDGIEVRDDTAR